MQKKKKNGGNGHYLCQTNWSIHSTGIKILQSFVFCITDTWKKRTVALYLRNMNSAKVIYMENLKTKCMQSDNSQANNNSTSSCFYFRRDFRILFLEIAQLCNGLHVSFRDCGSFTGRFPGALLCLLCLNTLNPVFVSVRERPRCHL